MRLAVSVRDFCRRFGKQHVWIALSGGLDSRVLLDLCQVIRAETSLTFHVVHVHHGLSPYADHWAEQCKQLCKQADFDFHASFVKLDQSSGDSLEEAARSARYEVFASFMKAEDLLLTAHHQDDQAETVLLQLLRGAGPKGLSAMPVIKPFASGLHGRPLLSFSRETLLAYATSRQLAWVDDESNANRAYTRNFIRHDIMTLLKTRWPNVESTLARSAQHCAEAQGLLEEVAQEKLSTVQGAANHTLSVSKLLTYSEAWQRLLLRSWIVQQGFSVPDTNKLISIQQSVLGAARDRMPCVSWAGVGVRRHRDDLYILSTERLQVEAGMALRPEIGPVIMRFRLPGESVEVLARGKVSLKNLFQEWRVPAWERGSLPLLFCNNKLIQVPGYFMDPAYFL